MTTIRIRRRAASMIYRAGAIIMRMLGCGDPACASRED
jgi:hypothetical protein